MCIRNVAQYENPYYFYPPSALGCYFDPNIPEIKLQARDRLDMTYTFGSYTNVPHPLGEREDGNWTRKDLAMR